MASSYVKSIKDTCKLPSDLVLDERILNDLEMLLIGGFHPLQSFLNMKDFCSVVEHGCLASGTLWPLPVILPFTLSLNDCKTANKKTMKEQTNTFQIESKENLASQLAGSKTINLRDSKNKIIATIKVEDWYEITDVDTVGKYLLNSSDDSHPYLNFLKQFNPLYCVGGQVKLINEIEHFDFLHYRMTPHKVKQFIEEKNLTNVVGFQTRNPMHRSHFELTIQAVEKVAKETSEKTSLLLTPVCGETQSDDIPYHIRVKCYEKLLNEYQKVINKTNSVISQVKLVLIPLAMRMAGPREAVFHALIRKNYGCTHFIIGRDHAGPSVKKKDGNSFFGPYEAHSYISSIKPGVLGIQPVLGKSILYVKAPAAATTTTTSRGNGIMSFDNFVKAVNEERESVKEEEDGFFISEDKQSEYDSSHICTISGTQLRTMLRERKPIPKWYSFPGVIQELQSFYKPLYELGFCLYVTGLPCSGKTTLTMAVEACLRENYSEQRNIIVLDADIMRKSLSKELGFDKASRQTHVRRLGYVASLVVKSGAICLVANIAPYEQDRNFNRKVITETGGGYIEVYLSTPLKVCEERDVKGLYAHARKDNLPMLTGVSDPYEIPSNPELVLGGVSGAVNEAHKVIEYLCERGWVKKKKLNMHTRILRE